MRKLLQRLTFGGVLAGLLLAGWATPTVWANAYGQNKYGTCRYQMCPTVASPPLKLPSGLEVAVNLSDGQIIPRTGYDIIVTPLNGQGTSFQHVDFYLDGRHVHTAFPDELGTAHWFWDPEQKAGTAVTIIVTGTDGTTATREYRVRLERTADSAPGAQAATTGIFTAVGDRLSRITQPLEKVIADLPPPIVYGSPYFLLLLLIINLLLLLMQAKRELTEYHTRKALFTRERTAEEAKRSFLALASHYLRTPVSIMTGGLELMEHGTKRPVQPDALATTMSRIGQQVEQLITHIQLPPDTVATTATRPVRAWRQAGLILPIVFIGVLACGCNILAAKSGAFTLAEWNLFIQITLFTVIALATYQLFRRRLLRQRDRQEIERITAIEQDLAVARDKFIANVATTLKADLRTLGGLLRSVSPQAAKFINNGQRQLQTVLIKCQVIAALRGIQSTQPPTQLLSTVLFAKAQQLAGPHTASLQPPVDNTIAIREPQLIAYVLGTLLDNALAYSTNAQAIRVTIQDTAAETAISVTDNGVGIAASKLSTLFQPFSKTDNAERVIHEGMGLSLYMDKIIMTYLGGTIDLQSTPGKGTIATLHVPHAA
jgi:signal transduction histidine kinase